MSEHQPDQARFDHVDATGKLVFAVGDARFAVTVDDTLERAILEAKQIASESDAPRRPSGQSLPISQIQSLIRAGADPARVAERYGLSEALVRRFSATVETEKQYAIEQFLSVPAPKESRMHSVSEMIERSLAAARIRSEDVQWKATRRGLEPWRISAQFVSAGRTMRAEWSWNMHDNSVSCLNRTAKALLGEKNFSKKSEETSAHDDVKQSDDSFNVPHDLPGDSARSARIEQVVSAWSTPEPSIPAIHPERSTSKSSSESSSDTSGESAKDSPTSHDSAQNSSQESSDDQATSADSSDTGNSRQKDKAKDNARTSKPARRRSGRSAVPSWDEILFGD